MIKYLFIFSFLFISSYSHAQTESIIYPTLSDYRENKGLKAKVVVDKRSQSSILMVGGCDYKIHTDEDDKLNKLINKEYTLIQYKDSLFVNCRIIRNKWYGLSFFKNEKYLFFTGATSGLREHRKYMEYFSSGMGGAIGGAMDASQVYNYAIELSTGEVLFVTKKFMQELLSSQPELYEKYAAEKSPYYTGTILKYLEEASKK